MTVRLRHWHLINADGRVVGRLAGEIATLLQGKKKSYFSNYDDVGDYCVVINANKMKVSGRKEEQKKYYSHSTWPGGLKTTLYKDMTSTNILTRAVKGMVPRNLLRHQRMARLRIFDNEQHPFEGNIFKQNNEVIQQQMTKNEEYLRQLLQIEQE